MVRNANVFDPILVTTLEPVELRAKIDNLSTYIVTLQIISTTLAERALPQYWGLVTALNEHDSEEAKSFNCDDTRLNHFFSNESSFKTPTELKSVVKLNLVLSLGQASVEREFKVNKTVYEVKMNEKSVVLHKSIIDHMQKNSLLPSTIETTNKLIRSV